MSTPMPPQESTSPAHPNAPAGATSTVLSFLEQATSSPSTQDAHAHAIPSPDALLDEAAAAAAPTMLGTAHNMLHRLTSSSFAQHAHATPSPEAILLADEAAVAAAPTVLGAAQNAFHRLTSPSSTQRAHAHATPSPETLVIVDEAAVAATPTVLGAAQNAFSKLAHVASHAIPHATRAPEASSPPEWPQQRAADLTAQGQASSSISSRGGGSGEGRAVTPPPRGVARVTRSYPALPDAMHLPLPVRVSHAQRRPTGKHADGETAWPFDDVDPHREKCVSERLRATYISAETEQEKCTRKAKLTGLLQTIAIALQVLLGALTTALGAALAGKKTSSVAVSVLGGLSTLVASYIARTKGSNEPQASKFRAKALDHFLREITAFCLDHGHEIGAKWDVRIDGFRFGLERILGNHPGSLAVDANMGNNNSGAEKWGASMGPTNTGPSGNGKYPTTMDTKQGYV